MAIGEFTIKDASAKCGTHLMTPNLVVQLDIAASTTNSDIYVMPPTGSGVRPYGVCLTTVKKSSLDNTTVLPGQDVSIRHVPGSFVFIRAFSAIAIGDDLVIADTVGRVATAGAGVETVGRALTPASALDDTVLVVLTLAKR